MSKVEIIDTPGLGMNENEDKRAISNIINYVKSKERINAFIFVMNYNDYRFSSTIRTIFKKFAYVFSKRFLDNTVVVFTHWDESEKAIYTR